MKYLKYIALTCSFIFTLTLMQANMKNNIPISVLFESPQQAAVKISPDGLMLSYLKPDSQNKLQVWIAPINDISNAQQVTTDSKRSILNYFWHHDCQHILYLQDDNGNENWNIFKINILNKETSNLTSFEAVQVRLVHYDKLHPNTLIFSMNKENKEIHDLYALNLTSHKVTLLEKGSKNTTTWVLSNQSLQPLFQEISEEDGSKTLLKKEGNSWKPFIEWSFEDIHTSEVLHTTKDDQFLYILDSRNKNLNKLVKINIINNKAQVIAADEQYELDRTFLNLDTFEVEAISCNRQRSEWIICSNSIREDFKTLEKLHSGDFIITSRSKDNKLWTVCYNKDTEPATYYLYNQETKTGTFLFHARPKLQKYKLQSMKPVSFTSRDGLTIHGYLTKPEQETNASLPLVLLVHGGPWARDNWGYNPEVQWLANRGYACLQVNYRGSTGYGKSFVNAGNKEWGNKVINDLVDGVNWCVKHHNINPNRVAVLGASHGGYSALACATFTENVFTCAIDLFGRSNLMGRFTGIPPYWKRYINQFKKMFGDPETERELIESMSPLFYADQIKIPMFIIHGAKDARINQSESDNIVEALKKNNIPHQYLVFENEGHGFINQENRFTCYRQIEEFLQRHL